LFAPWRFRCARNKTRICLHPHSILRRVPCNKLSGYYLAFAAADDPKVLEVGKGLKIDGMLDKAKPQQVYHVKLHKGGTYVIDMVSPNPKALDPFLRLLDAAGKTLASDDDSGGGLNARIVFLAPALGTYQVMAGSAASVLKLEGDQP